MGAADMTIGTPQGYVWYDGGWRRLATTSTEEWRLGMTEDEAPVTDVTADDPPEDGGDATAEDTADQEDVPLLVNDVAPEDDEDEP